MTVSLVCITIVPSATAPKALTSPRSSRGPIGWFGFSIRVSTAGNNIFASIPNRLRLNLFRILPPQLRSSLE